MWDIVLLPSIRSYFRPWVDRAKVKTIFWVRTMTSSCSWLRSWGSIGSCWCIFAAVARKSRYLIPPWHNGAKCSRNCGSSWHTATDSCGNTYEEMVGWCLPSFWLLASRACSLECDRPIYWRSWARFQAGGESTGGWFLPMLVRVLTFYYESSSYNPKRIFLTLAVNCFLSVPARTVSLLRLSARYEAEPS